MLERETMSVEQMAGMIKAQLQNTDLSSEEKLELESQRSDVEAALAELYRKRDEQNQLDMDTKKALDKSKTEAQLLRENQKWLAKYNFYHEVKIEPSPNSFYNLNTLENYYKTILQKIDTLLDKQKKIVELLGGQRMFNSRTPLVYMYSLENEFKKIGDRILVLESYTKVAKEDLGRGGYSCSQLMGLRIASFFNSYLRTIINEFELLCMRNDMIWGFQWWRLEEQTDNQHYHTELTIPPIRSQQKLSVEKTVDFGSCELVSPIPKSLSLLLSYTSPPFTPSPPSKTPPVRHQLFFLNNRPLYSTPRSQDRL
ncbi:hypothetical protein BASA60_005815 [Batrachochytrium salamandrivorans]|nr:hypothetical protein BASA60_005815 [Batrachochytrium salamandrivorans]